MQAIRVQTLKTWNSTRMDPPFLSVIASSTSSTRSYLCTSTGVLMPYKQSYSWQSITLDTWITNHGTSSVSMNIDDCRSKRNSCQSLLAILTNCTIGFLPCFTVILKIKIDKVGSASGRAPIRWRIGAADVLKTRLTNLHLVRSKNIYLFLVVMVSTRYCFFPSYHLFFMMVSVL